jgi:hypothetical protein
MFGLFKRTKIEDWEIQLLRNVVTKLPDEYSGLINQINDDLFRGVLVGVSDIPGYVAFTFHPEVLHKYDRKNERDFKLTDIKVYDRKSSNFLPYEIYVSSGTISGYSLGGNKKRNVDLSKIDVSGFKKELIGESDYNRIVNLLDEEEKIVLSPSEVYSVFLDNKEYFHIKDLEDGDFIGMDTKKIIYKITHDPMEVHRIDKTLKEILS